MQKQYIVVISTYSHHDWDTQVVGGSRNDAAVKARAEWQREMGRKGVLHAVINKMEVRQVQNPR